jgi:multisubunit Na+/H+ antiporter MnhC subunit
MAKKWTASECVGAGVVFAAVAAVAVLIAAGPEESSSGPNSPDLLCAPLLQPFAVTAWVISFAFTALWLLTHCESRPSISAT